MRRRDNPPLPIASFHSAHLCSPSPSASVGTFHTTNLGFQLYVWKIESIDPNKPPPAPNNFQPNRTWLDDKRLGRLEILKILLGSACDADHLNERYIRSEGGNPGLGVLHMPRLHTQFKFVGGGWLLIVLLRRFFVPSRPNLIPHSLTRPSPELY